MASTANDDNLTIAVTGATDSSLILSSTGTAADALQIKATAGTGGIDINAGTGGIDIETTGKLSIDSAGAPTNITHTSAGVAGALKTAAVAFTTVSNISAAGGQTINGLVTTTNGRGSGAVVTVVTLSLIHI